MLITETELKENFEKYLSLSSTEDIFITQNGEIVAKFTNPFKDRIDIAKSLFGILPNILRPEEIMEERHSKQ